MEPDLTAAIADAVARALRPILDDLANALAIDPTPADPDHDPEDDAPGRVRMSRDADGDAERQALEDALDSERARVVRLTYEREFDALEADGVSFDRDQELDALLDLPVRLRDGHLDRMREQYKRSAIGRRGMILTASPLDNDTPPSPDEREAVIAYATKNGIADLGAAREKYRATRDGRS